MSCPSTTGILVGRESILASSDRVASSPPEVLDSALVQVAGKTDTIIAQKIVHREIQGQVTPFERFNGFLFHLFRITRTSTT
jgi:hypothetical protein